ncbi:hypothetical protein NQ315_009140 [Exocentrus adspersus]|uniref:Uncharacterized protein n=1 Tax=Exocentrus adspersus TaxID=1586481 RepID=A0AAV8WGV4_9CUCU|nr:hypothetical protein NQ315_009140 [Exocentrus adspersus]
MARLILCFFILLPCVIVMQQLDLPPQSKVKTNSESNNRLDDKDDKSKSKGEEEIDVGIPQINNIASVKKQTKKEDVASVSSVNAKSVTPTKASVNDSNMKIGTNTNQNTEIESGALMRGIFVFVGITMLFIMYIAYKTYRRKNNNVVIKKYGVRTRKSDIEMEPLPLDEDDEDETVFDLGNINSR